MDFFAFLKRNRKNQEQRRGKRELVRSKFFRLGVDQREDRTLLISVLDNLTDRLGLLNGQAGGNLPQGAT
jgi:hypothetical protein